MKSGGPQKKIFRRKAPEFVPPTYNLLPTPLGYQKKICGGDGCHDRRLIPIDGFVRKV